MKHPLNQFRIVFGYYEFFHMWSPNSGQTDLLFFNATIQLDHGQLFFFRAPERPKQRVGIFVACPYMELQK